MPWSGVVPSHEVGGGNWGPFGLGKPCSWPGAPLPGLQEPISNSLTEAVPRSDNPRQGFTFSITPSLRKVQLPQPLLASLQFVAPPQPLQSQAWFEEQCQEPFPRTRL